MLRVAAVGEELNSGDIGTKVGIDGVSRSPVQMGKQRGVVRDLRAGRRE